MSDVIGADVVVIGGGIAGASVAFELARTHRVALIERETTLAYHATGRSAAMFLQTYGPPDVRRMTVAARAFLTDPPPSFERPLLTPRALLQIAPTGSERLVDDLYAETVALIPDLRIVDEHELRALCPYLQPGAFGRGLFEPSAQEIDVHALHQGFVRGLRERGGVILKDAGAATIESHGPAWTVTLGDGRRLRAGRVVNAAGAWADQIATSAGLGGIGLRPLRRTLFTIAAPHGLAVRDLPLVYDLAERFYIKPEGEGLLCSPADEAPVAAGDAKADTLQIARALDDIRETTTLRAKSVGHSWAGLRTFSPDGDLVIGEDPDAPGFFWLAGQGGYGMQTAPSAARIAAALVRGDDIPADLADLGLDADRLSPARFAAGR